MADKKIVKIIKLQIPGGKATPAPPVGPALGQAGININEFTTQFNEKTKDRMGETVPVVIYSYEDRTFSFEMKVAPASELIRKAAGISKGSGQPHINKVGSLTWDQVKEVAEKKMPDLNANDIEAAANIIAGTARSMGVTVERPEAN